MFCYKLRSFIDKINLIPVFNFPINPLISIYISKNVGLSFTFFPYFTLSLTHPWSVVVNNLNLKIKRSHYL